MSQEVIENNRITKFLVFKLGGERYAMSLAEVREVIGITDITGIPQVPAFFKGIINLRGRIISVVDLRLKFALKEAEYRPKRTTIIITEIGEIILGVVVDEVVEVAGFGTSQIEEDLTIQSKVSRNYIKGVAKGNDKQLVLLLDIEKTLSLDELQTLKRHVS